MNLSEPIEDPRAEAAVLETMAFLSTLTTAAEVRHRIRERRAGRDPSAQEATDFARHNLERTGREFQELLMRLHASLVRARFHDENRLAALLRRFDDLLKLNRAGRLLHLIHQRLLSLYPAVPEDLVERARLLEGECQTIGEAEDDAFLEALEAFLNGALGFTAQLRRAA